MFAFATKQWKALKIRYCDAFNYSRGECFTGKTISTEKWRVKRYRSRWSSLNVLPVLQYAPFPAIYDCLNFFCKSRLAQPASKLSCKRIVKNCVQSKVILRRRAFAEEIRTGGKQQANFPAETIKGNFSYFTRRISAPLFVFYSLGPAVERKIMRHVRSQNCHSMINNEKSIFDRWASLYFFFTSVRDFRYTRRVAQQVVGRFSEGFSFSVTFSRP